jgi:hypothetical protein
MTTTDKALNIRETRAARPLIAWSVGLFVGAVVTLLAGVGVAALLARRGDAAIWSKWSDVGQTFGALSSIISGLALVAVVVTARAQFRELANNHSELRRTAQASHGMLHLEILKMSIEDPDLARVWPPFLPNLPASLNRQYLYANVIYQFHWTSMRIGDYTDEEVLASLRYLFTSPLMRDYWRAAEYARTSLSPGSDEYIFAQKVDQVCREYEAVVASATGPTAERAVTTLRDNEKPAQAA